MSIHSSLRTGGKDKRHRSVLKRFERLQTLSSKKLWDHEKSPMGLPKVKVQRIKVKKEKPAAEKTAEGAPAASSTAQAAKPAAKPAAK